MFAVHFTHTVSALRSFLERPRALTRVFPSGTARSVDTDE